MHFTEKNIKLYMSSQGYSFECNQIYFTIIWQYHIDIKQELLIGMFLLIKKESKWK